MERWEFVVVKQMLESSLGSVAYIFEDAVLKAALLWDSYNRWNSCFSLFHIPEGVFSGERINLHQSLARGPKFN